VKAASYSEYGAARDVLQVGELPDPQPGPGQVRVRVRYSGINPSDCHRRSGMRDRPGYPLIIPHSDGSGDIDGVGEGVSRDRIGEQVWIWNAQRHPSALPPSTSPCRRRKPSRCRAGRASRTAPASASRP
jgi:NADPH2:quinone reductase